MTSTAVRMCLTPPDRDPRGPDGAGWNRLSMPWSSGAQCALRPRSWGAAHILARRPRCVTWGGHGPCIRAGQCDTCPIATTPPRRLNLDGPRHVVRIDPVRTRKPEGDPWLWVMLDTDPRAGWDSVGWMWSWDDITRVSGWGIGRRDLDEHGEWFWLDREEDQPRCPSMAGAL